jgi:hypothetical protein
MLKHKIMGNSVSSNRTINFEDMQFAINEQQNKSTNYGQNQPLIINTLDAHQQSCLIAGTLDVAMEIEMLNFQLKKNKDVQVIIYGMNSTDKTCEKKYEQLMKLGFWNVYIYVGGLFEWLLLQDVYGAELFPTTAVKVDLLKYKGRRQLNIKLLENY